ncbi:NACHT domain-containing protein [Actinoplanes cyaneus]|uniref:NACHT domain-containing protein n=1 Tax=Actinoplanes cyaneus TaxID=52696 RepID=UPI0019420624|nr:NACHT domain-containing protein [Actinoplanes cyaneus]
MSRTVLRIVQITLAAVGSLVVIPYAVNTAPPAWLTTHVAALRVVALGCLALIIVFQAVDGLTAPGETRVWLGANHPHNLDLAVRRVETYLRQRQEGLLSERIRIMLEERPDAVRQPVHLVRRVGGAEHEISGTRRVVEVFDEMTGSMLILGAPGAGKTTQLIDLAQQLLTRARARREASIPVLFDLSDWVNSRPSRWNLRRRGDDEETRTVRSWLLGELEERYGFHRWLSRRWLRENRFVVLLDGLDEVPARLREACVDQINQMQRDAQVARIAVCSREVEYEKLTRRLRLQGAVLVRPLTREQVLEYLAVAKPRLAEIAATLDEDEALWELLTTPLMLSVMMLAHYQGQDWQAVILHADPEEKRRRIFDAYIVEVLARPRAQQGAPPVQTLQTLKTLSELAGRRESGIQVVFPGRTDLRSVLPSEVSDLVRQWLVPLPFAVCLAACAAVLGRLGGVTAAAVMIVVCAGVLLRFPARPGPGTPGGDAALARLSGFLAVVLAGVTVIVLGVDALSTGFDSVLALIVLVLLVSVVDIALLLTFGGPHIALILAVFGLLFLVAMTTAASGVDEVAVRSAVIGLFCVVAVVCLIVCDTTLRPPSEFASGAAIRVVEALVTMMIAVAVAGLAATPRPSAAAALTGWVVGVLFGYPVAHAVARAVQIPMARAAAAVLRRPDPWNGAFLAYAADRSLLISADFGYRFVHLLIRDHLAEIDPERLAGEVRLRRLEIGSA